MRLKQRGLDGVTLLVLPGVFVVLALFIYPFLYGLFLSFAPKQGAWFANYARFFADPFLYNTITTTMLIAVPATLVNVVFSIPVALRVRLMNSQRLLTTILVVPITLGTVLVAEGLLTYLGPRGWVNRVLMGIGLIEHPILLIHNYWGVLLSLIITGFPFTFLLTLSYVTGIDNSLEQAAPEPLARPRPEHRAGLLQRVVDAGHVGQGQQESERKAGDDQRQEDAPVVVDEQHRVLDDAQSHQHPIEPAARTEIGQQPLGHQHRAERDRHHEDRRQQPRIGHQANAQRHRDGEHDIHQRRRHRDQQRRADRVVQKWIGEERRVIREPPALFRREGQKQPVQERIDEQRQHDEHAGQHEQRHAVQAALLQPHPQRNAVGNPARDAGMRVGRDAHAANASA